MSQRQVHSEEIETEETRQQLGKTSHTARQANNDFSLEQIKGPNCSSHYTSRTASSSSLSANSRTASIQNAQNSEERASQDNSDYSQNPHPIIYYQSKMYELREIINNKSNIFHLKAHLEAKMIEKDRQIDDLKEKMRVKNGQIQDFEEIMKKTIPQIDDLKEKMRIKDQHIDDLEKKMGEKNPQIDNLKEQIRVKDRQIEDFEKKMRKNDPQIDDLKDKMKVKDRYIEDLEEKMGKKNRQISALKNKSKEQSNQIQALKSQLVRLKQGGQYKAQKKNCPIVEQQQHQRQGYTQYLHSAQNEQKLESSHTSSCEETIKKLRQKVKALQVQAYNTKFFQGKLIKALQQNGALQYKLQKALQQNGALQYNFEEFKKACQRPHLIIDSSFEKILSECSESKRKKKGEELP